MATKSPMHLAPCTLHLSRSHGDRWDATDQQPFSLHLILFSDSLRASQNFTLSNKRYYSPKPLLYNLAEADLDLANK